VCNDGVVAIGRERWRMWKRWKCEASIRGDDVVRMTILLFLPYLHRLITLLYYSHIGYAE
jgi:hypothetical protein